MILPEVTTVTDIERLAAFITSQVDTLPMVTCRALAEDIADAGFLKARNAFDEPSDIEPFGDLLRYGKMADRQILDAKKIADEIEALRNGDQEYDFICNITEYHLKLFAEGLRALVASSGHPPPPPADTP